MKVLVITNISNNTLNPSLTHLFGAVKKLTSACDVLLIGNNLVNISNQIANYSTVKQVLIMEHTDLDKPLAENIAPQLAELSKNYTHVLISADSFGKNLLPRVAGILAIGQISEIVDVLSINIFKKFIYAGNVLIETESLEEIKLLTVRTSSFPSDESQKSSPAPIINLTYNGNSYDRVKIIATHTANKAVDLSEAKTIVTGGVSLGSKEAFDQYIRQLANKLNAGVGASRAAVEAGFAHNDCQIGQTGKVVAPNVYMAIGISGAVQHIAGMKDSKTVIAINTDSGAPIFEHADYGLVADLFTVIPELINKI